MRSRLTFFLEALTAVIIIGACSEETQRANRRSPFSEHESQGVVDDKSDSPGAKGKNEGSQEASSGSSVPNLDIDPEASFNLIPKEGDLSAKINRSNFPGGESLGLTDSKQEKKSKQDYFLAINKRDLEKNWFLTAMTKQLYPADPQITEPFLNLGTRVVQFKEQNGKLFVFDVSQRKSNGDMIDPTVLIDAYPIVPQASLPKGIGSMEKFVVFDPALGVSQHGPIQDIFAARTSGALSFKTDLQYMHKFEKTRDGIYYEMAFSGVAQGDFTRGGVIDTQDPNPGRVVGTLGLSIRRYQATPEFKTMDLSELNAPYYFAGLSASQNPLKGAQANPVWKWGQIKPGMKPIVFWLTSGINQTQKEFPSYGIKAAVIRGVEEWNNVFGFKVFEIREATAEKSWAADDTNMIIWDPKGKLGYAYADMRLNPKNGEIRGANIYIDAGFLPYLEDLYKELSPSDSDNASGSGDASKRLSKTGRFTGFSWGNMKPHLVCGRSLSSLSLSAHRPRSVPFKNTLKLSRKTAVENWLAAVITHEVGHTLGLRHNFLGSTYGDQESSSIMDYIDDFQQAYVPKPGVYDEAAVKYLYGLAPNQPEYPFCTDEDQATNPLCRKFDFGVEPLQTSLLPRFETLSQMYRNDPKPDLEYPLQLAMQQVLDFFQGGNSTLKSKAWTGLMQNLKATPNGTNTPPPPAVDTMAQWVIDGAFMTPNPDSAFSIGFNQKPNLESALATQVASDLAAIGFNSDKGRSLPSRILAINALRKMQSDDGLKALLQLKQDLKKRVSGMPEGEALVENDLISRIEKHLSPYFD